MTGTGERRWLFARVRRQVSQKPYKTALDKIGQVAMIPDTKGRRDSDFGYEVLSPEF
jgi:hypothetical protein